MTVELETGWNLRSVMASRGIFQTSKLRPLLEERGIGLSREQVYRLVTQPPQRVRLDVLAALCDALECSLDDLVTITRREVATRSPWAKKRLAGRSAISGPFAPPSAVHAPSRPSWPSRRRSRVSQRS